MGNFFYINKLTAKRFILRFQPETEWKWDLVLLGFFREIEPIECICAYGKRDRDFKPLTHKFVEVGKSKIDWQGRAEQRLETQGRVDIAG